MLAMWNERDGEKEKKRIVANFAEFSYHIRTQKDLLLSKASDFYVRRPVVTVTCKMDV